MCRGVLEGLSRSCTHVGVPGRRSAVLRAAPVLGSTLGARRRPGGSKIAFDFFLAKMSGLTPGP